MSLNYAEKYIIVEVGLGFSGIRTHNLLISSQTDCYMSYRASVSFQSFLYFVLGVKLQDWRLNYRIKPQHCLKLPITWIRKASLVHPTHRYPSFSVVSASVLIFRRSTCKSQLLVLPATLLFASSACERHARTPTSRSGGSTWIWKRRNITRIVSSLWLITSFEKVRHYADTFF